MASCLYWLAGMFVFAAVPSCPAFLTDDSYKQELLAAINAKRAEFGFADQFALAKTDTTDANLLREAYRRTIDEYVNAETARWLDLKRFEKSRPLYFQVGYNTASFKKPGKEVKASAVVALWSRRSSPDKATMSTADTDKLFPGSRSVFFICDGLWPFVTKTADQNLIIERGEGKWNQDFAFTVMFPDYESAKVSTEQRKEFAQTKTLERCLTRQTADYQAKLKTFMCDAKNLDKKNAYKKFKEGISEFVACVQETLWEGFRQAVDARERIVIAVCSDPDIFKKKTGGVLKSLEFKDALDADKNIGPFAKFSTL